ncbi:MAG: PAS domain S-box protein [Deltaproteobacteria bacterium]|nr:PAS domain S-box protein [Deltaproteobacteria bacterium]
MKRDLQADSSEPAQRIRDLESELARRQAEFDEMTMEMALAISEFFQVMGQLTEGDFSVRASESSRFELFAKFGETINTTIEQLEARTENLTNTNKLLRQEIRERKRADEELAEEKELLTVTLRSIGDGVVSTDRQGKVVLMNRAAEELTGWSRDEAEDRLLADVFHAIDEESREPCPNPVKSVIEANDAVVLDNQTLLISKDGGEYIVAVSGAPIYDKGGNVIGVVLVFRDVTEKRKMEEEMMRAEKLESMGILAGGIAHDFNNTLLAIVGSITLARKALARQGVSSSRLEDAEKACLLATGLTQQLLTFSKGGMPVKRTASIKRMLEDTSVFALSGSNIMKTVDVDDDVWSVDIDVGQISQVINNLTINAKQAMPDGGEIRIHTGNVVVTGDMNLPLDEGRYVRLSVRDNGIGILGDDLPKIFDPFFTTKDEGSGLGLATTFSVIKKHGGHIDVESRPGDGTTFSIYLPASESKQTEKRHPSEEKRKRAEKILLMDDEETIREVVGELLVDVGCELDFAKEGKEAIEKYVQAKESGKPFDIVILDLTIVGGMGGKRAMSQLLEIDPAVKAIVSSGYSNDQIMANYREFGFSGALTKPFRIDDLLKIIEGIMGAT